MKFPGFGLFLFFAYLAQIKAKINFDANSTRVTSKRLWTMADNTNDIHNFIFGKLKGFAEDCCRNKIYGHGLSDCAGKQLGYWAHVEKTVWDGQNTPDKKDDLEEWLDDRYNPDAIYPFDSNYSSWLCHGVLDHTGQITDNGEFPSFSAVLKTSPPDVGHTEARLIPRMTIAAKSLMNEGIPANFFLFTQNSPCGSGFPQNCQQKIFKFTADEMYINSLRYHSLAVGFYKWYRPLGKYSVAQARQRFCDYVTEQKTKPEYTSINFFPGLFFKKVTAEGGDAAYNPPDGDC